MCGLALSNQHASVLVLVPLAFYVLFSLNRAFLLSWRAAAELGGLWLPLGLSSYVALVVSARHPQQGSWGDLSSLWGFARHLFRVEYGTFRLGVMTANAEGALDRVRQYLVDSSLQTMHVGPPLALLGIGWALKAPRASGSKKEARTFAIGLVSAWTSYVFIWHGVLSNISLHHPMSRAVHARFWMQPNLVLCLAAGGGLGVVVNVTIRKCRLGLSTTCRLSRQSTVEVESLLLSAAIAAGMVWLRWDTVNRGIWSGRSHGWTMHLYGQVRVGVMFFIIFVRRSPQTTKRSVIGLMSNTASPKLQHESSTLQ